MNYKIHKHIIFTLLILAGSLFWVMVPAETVYANHAKCNDGTLVPESSTDPGFCADRAGLASGTPTLLCENGNFSNTVSGCENQGSTHVTSAEIAEACKNKDTQEARAQCAKAGGNPDGDCKGDILTKDNCGIIHYLVLFIKILSGLVGVVVIAMIIIGGIQYSTAQGNPQSVAAARKRIGNAVLALIVYVFAFAFLQWLVPGGVL